MNITAITVLIEIDGKVCLAPVDPEHSMMFLGMLRAYQAGERETTQLIKLPPDVVKHVYAMGEALHERLQPAHQGEGRE